MHKKDKMINRVVIDPCNSIDEITSKIDADYFEEVFSVCQEIDSLNQTYEDMILNDQIDIDMNVKLIKEYIKQQQIEPYQTLRELAKSYPIEAVGELIGKREQLSDKIAEIALLLSVLEEKRDEKEAKIEEEKNLIQKTFPQLARQAIANAVQLKDQNNAEFEKDLRLLVLQSDVCVERIQDCEYVLEFAGKAWSVPWLAGEEDLETNADDNSSIVDIFPVEKAEIKRREIIEKYHRNSAQEYMLDASERFARILSEVPGFEYSFSDMAHALYGQDSKINRSRCSALLSNYERGKITIIGEVLQDQDLILQRGTRTMPVIDKNGVVKQTPFTLIRALPINQNDQSNNN